MSFADDDVCGGSIRCRASVLVQRRCLERRGAGVGEVEGEGMNQAETAFELNWLSVELGPNSAKHPWDPQPPVP